MYLMDLSKLKIVVIFTQLILKTKYMISNDEYSYFSSTSVFFFLLFNCVREML